MNEQDSPPNQASESTPRPNSEKPARNEFHIQRHDVRTRSAGRPQRTSPPIAPSPREGDGSNYTRGTLYTKRELRRLDTSPNERGENRAFHRPDRLRQLFKVGRVFLTLWSEPPEGGGQENDGSRKSASYSAFRKPDVEINSFVEEVFSKVRRFTVVRDNNDSCRALAITTHGGRGSMNTEHGIVYTSNPTPPTDMPDDETSNLKKEVRPVQMQYGPESLVVEREFNVPMHVQRPWFGYLHCDQPNCLDTMSHLNLGVVVEHGESAGYLKPRFIQMYHPSDVLQQKVASVSLTRELGWTHELVDDYDDEDGTGRRRRVNQLMVEHPDSVKACTLLHDRKSNVFQMAQVLFEVLLEVGAAYKPSGEDAIRTHDSYGRNALQMAVAGGHDKFVQMLLSCDSPDEGEDDVPSKHHVRWTQGYTRKLTKAAILAMKMPCLRVLHNYGTSHGPLPTTRDSLGDLSLMTFTIHEPAWLAHPDPLLLLPASIAATSLMASYRRRNSSDRAQDIIIGISLITSIAAGLLAGHSMAYTTLTIVPGAICASLLLSDAFHTGLRMGQRYAVMSWNDERKSTADSLAKYNMREKCGNPVNGDGLRDSEDLEAQNG